jgi:Fur family ferric uptake transcriptional regulator
MPAGSALYSARGALRRPLALSPPSHVTRSESTFVEYLKQRGFKVTRQRMTILEAIFESREHFTAEQLHRRLVEAGQRVSLATVYRSVNVLVEGGFLEALDVGGGQMLYERVEGAEEHHDHLVCLACGAIEEFRCDEIERLQEEAAAERGFEITHHSLRIFGRCRECRQSGRAERVPLPPKLAASPRP